MGDLDLLVLNSNLVVCLKIMAKADYFFSLALKKVIVYLNRAPRGGSTAEMDKKISSLLKKQIFQGAKTVSPAECVIFLFLELFFLRSVDDTFTKKENR